MLPSMGYFSAIPCVFYLAGNCERPHCHYRHCIKDKTANGEVVSSNVSSEKADWLGPNLSVSMVTTMVEKLVDKIFVEEPEKTRKLDRDQVVREALHRLKKESVLKKINPHTSPSTSAIPGIPAYRPTPIAELNKRHIPVVYAPERPQITKRHEKPIEEKQAFRPTSPSTASSKRQHNDSQTSLENNPAAVPVDAINVNEDVHISPSELQPRFTLPISSDIGSNSQKKELFNPCANHNITYNHENIPISLADDTSKLLESRDTITSNSTVKPMVNKESNVESMTVSSPQISKSSIGSCDMETSTKHESALSETSSSNCKEDLVKYQSESVVDKDHKHRSESKSTTELNSAKNMSTSMKSKHSHDISKHKHKTKEKGHRKSLDDKEKQESRKRKHSSERSLDSKSSSSKKTRDPKAVNVDKVKKEPEKAATSTGDSKKHSDKHKDKKRDKHHNSHKHHDHHTKKTETAVKPNTCESAFDKLLGKTTDKSSSSHSKDKSSSHSSSKSTSARASGKSSSTSAKHNQDEPLRKKSRLDKEGLSEMKNHRSDSKCSTEKQDSKKRSYPCDPKQDILGNNTALAYSKYKEMNHRRHRSQPINGHDHAATSIQNREASQSEVFHPLESSFGSISISSESSGSPPPEEFSSSEEQYHSSRQSGTNRSDCVNDSNWSKAKEIIQKNSGPKIRIAHVPNVSNILSAKTKILAKAQPVPEPVEASRASGFAIDEPHPVVQRRIAHISESNNAKRPTVALPSDATKVPLSVRHQYCKSLFIEFQKWYTSEDALTKAQQEELKLATSANGLKIYKNRCSLYLLKIRKNNGCEDTPESSSPDDLHPASCLEYTYGWSLYKCFAKYLLSPEELIQNGFPTPLPGHKNCAYIHKEARRFSIQQPADRYTKICVNCSKTYQIDDDGMPTTTNDCYYHWGRLRKVRGGGQVVEKFTCCHGSDDSYPCQSSMYHVWSGCNEDYMVGFVTTREFRGPDETSAGVYALDCEMCYTTQGLELARLTVVDLNEKLVFDEVVAMENPILDYCTRFSGIDEDKIAKATYTFADIREWVLKNIFDKTIIVGHSLENDLKALKIFHGNVVDTSMVFPHKYGPPMRCSLKYLATSILSTTIQDSDKGHDSKEDAITCLKLMMLKIKEDARARKPRFIIGYSGKK